MTATIRVLVYEPGEEVETGPASDPIRARVIRAMVLIGGGLRYELGWWQDGSWCSGWFPATEVRGSED